MLIRPLRLGRFWPILDMMYLVVCPTKCSRETFCCNLFQVPCNFFIKFTRLYEYWMPWFCHDFAHFFQKLPRSCKKLNCNFCSSSHHILLPWHFVTATFVVQIRLVPAAVVHGMICCTVHSCGWYHRATCWSFLVVLQRWTGHNCISFRILATASMSVRFWSFYISETICHIPCDMSVDNSEQNRTNFVCNCACVIYLVLSTWPRCDFLIWTF